MKRRSKLVRARQQRDIGLIHERTGEMVPFDLVTEILMRLPPKSLMRFKSVSKPWSSLICSQYFNKSFQRVASPSPRLYMCLDLDGKGVILSASSSPHSDNGTTMSSFIIDQNLTLPTMKGCFSHVFRGLMCFQDGSSSQIYNTTTRQLVVLPDIEELSNIIAENHKLKKIRYLIGHDPVHDQYKVVCTMSRQSDEVVGEYITFLSEHWVLLLGGDGSNRWRKISSSCPPHLALTQGLAINGGIHYLACIRIFDLHLVSFNMSSEKISMLQAPKDIFWKSGATQLIEYGGKVAVLDIFNLEKEGVMELWVLEDAEKNRWSRRKFGLHPSQTNIVNKTSLRIEGTTTNGEVILVPENIYINKRTGEVINYPQNTTLFYVLLYNIQKNHMEKVEITETSNRYLTKFWDVIGFYDIENLMYL